MGKKKARGAGKTPRKGTKDKEKVNFGVSLVDLISAGLIAPPVQLFRKYKGRRMDATLLADESVEFEGTRYSRCSDVRRPRKPREPPSPAAK